MFTNKLLVELLREPLAPVTVVTKQPADITSRMPLVYAHKSSGTEVHPLFADTEAIQVDVYTHGDEVACYALADQVRQVLHDAWRKQTVYPSGHIAFIQTLSTPFEFPDPVMPDDVCRYTAEYQLTVRPPAA